MNFSKMSKSIFTILFAFVVVANGFPGQDYRYFHPGTVMLGGYYGIPPMRYPDYITEDSEPVPAASEDFEKEVVTEDVLHDDVDVDEREFKEQSTGTPQVLNSFPKTKGVSTPKKPNSSKPRRKDVPEDDNPLSSNFPFGSGGSSFLNTFFPIMVGGNTRGRGKSGQDDDLGGPGGATAIANSFSTGRGGVASSHATSFGDVFLSPALNERFKKNNRI